MLEIQKRDQIIKQLSNDLKKERDECKRKDSALQKEIDLVLKYHGVEPQRFSKSYQFYRHHPKDFKILIIEF